jgi:hypothetical protein
MSAQGTDGNFPGSRSFFPDDGSATVAAAGLEEMPKCQSD